MITRDEVYRIGHIGKAHGLRGEVSFLFDDDVFDRVDADYIVLDIDGILVPFFIEEYRLRNDTTAIIKLEGIDSEERARELTHCDVFFPRELALDDDGDLSLAMLVGYTILEEGTQKPIGTITGIDDSTVNILFETLTSDGSEVLIPVVNDFIVSIDDGKQEIVMRLPEGLIEL